MRSALSHAPVGSVVLLLGALVSAPACAPAFQDARLVGPGRAEITPNASATLVSFGGETEHVANNFGVHAVFGLHQRVDVGLGYTRVQVAYEGENQGTNVIGFGPKFGLVKDRVALAAPLGLAVGGGVETSESVTFDPAVLFTIPVSERLDFNPSARLLIPFCEDCETLVGLNVGLGVSSTARRVVFRPEVGLLFNPGASGVIWSAGLGVSFRPRAR
jgi:hypothetical protein